MAVPARVNVSVSVMAHPARSRMVHDLTWALRNPPVAWDEKSDRWDTGRRALLLHQDSDYALVVQDDAILPRGFIGGVRNALAGVPPDSPLVLYCTRTKFWGPVLDKVPAETSYLIMDRIWWGVAICVPTHLIGEMVEWCDRLTDPHYDRRLGSWFHHRQIPVYYTWPNLVDHRHVPSLIEGRSAMRSAHNFVQGRADRLTWNGPTFHVKPPRQALGVVR